MLRGSEDRSRGRDLSRGDPRLLVTWCFLVSVRSEPENVTNRGDTAYMTIRARKGVLGREPGMRSGRMGGRQNHRAGNNRYN